jgi:hypothetical protein
MLNYEEALEKLRDEINMCFKAEVLSMRRFVIKLRLKGKPDLADTVEQSLDQIQVLLDEQGPDVEDKIDAEFVSLLRTLLKAS